MIDKRLGFIALTILVVSVFVMAFSMESEAAPKAPKAACGDKIDNDGDGYTDFPDDPGCSDKKDTSELDPNVECDDGSDNDGDGNTDMDDSGCSSPADNDETDCGDGVCEGGETSQSCPADCGYPDSCNDTDGGIYPFTFGMTYGYYSGDYFESDDYCVDSGSVMEHYCSGDYEQSSQQSCGTDGYAGGNYCMSGDVYRDYRNYFCSGGACGYNDTPVLQENCQYGCTNGTCDPMPDTCNDTDGGFVVDVTGTVSGYYQENPYSYTDYCVDNTSVMEYYCSGDYCYNWTFNCAINYTWCSNGACY